MQDVFRAVAALMIVALPSAAQSPADSLKSEISAIPAGSRIEVHLKNGPSARGTRGEVSDSGFTLVNAGSGGRQIAFADVSSVRQIGKSHKTRNILIVVGVGLIVVVAILAVHAVHCAPLGCNSHTF